MAIKSIKKPNIKGRVHNILDWKKKKIKGESPTVLCCGCGAVYYDEHWHTNEKMSAALRNQKGVAKDLCLECKMSKDVKQADVNWEGEVVLKNVGADEKQEMLNLVNNVGERATKRDPEDRIIKIENKKGEIRILTTENQLAVSIGRQVARAFKGGKLEIKWSNGEEVARVIWTKK